MIRPSMGRLLRLSPLFTPLLWSASPVSFRMRLKWRDISRRPGSSALLPGGETPRVARRTVAASAAGCQFFPDTGNIAVLSDASGGKPVAPPGEDRVIRERGSAGEGPTGREGQREPFPGGIRPQRVSIPAFVLDFREWGFPFLMELVYNGGGVKISFKTWMVSGNIISVMPCRITGSRSRD